MTWSSHFQKSDVVIDDWRRWGVGEAEVLCGLQWSCCSACIVLCNIYFTAQMDCLIQTAEEVVSRRPSWPEVPIVRSQMSWWGLKTIRRWRSWYTLRASMKFLFGGDSLMYYPYHFAKGLSHPGSWRVHEETSMLTFSSHCQKSVHFVLEQFPHQFDFKFCKTFPPRR